MRAILLPLLLIGMTPAHSAQPLLPEPQHPFVAGIVAAALTEYHYRDRPLDDGLSRCWFDAYVDGLDPDRSFFTAADLQEFDRYAASLDDLVQDSPPDLTPAFAVHARWQARARERVSWTRDALKSDPDLSDDETIELDRSELPWPADPAALQEVWRKELEDDWIRLSLGEESDKARERLSRRVDRLDETLDDLESADILELYLSTLAGCYDPHSTYLKPFSADDFTIATQGSLEGIGAALQDDGDMIRIEEVIAGGPADRSGQVFPEDKIVAVSQDDQPFVDVVGMRLDRVVQLIRGPKGTKVRLEIIPGSSVDLSERRVVEMIRDRIDLELVEPTAVIHEVPLAEGGTRRLLVIEVPAFVGEVDAATGDPRPSTSQQVATLLGQHPDADAAVLDLRENGGGLLDEAIALTGLFIDTGPVVRIRDGRGRIEEMGDMVPGRAWDKPLVVLTSPYSASASEIFAGALQDHGRALVVGSDTTYGKGSVQTVVPLDELLGNVAPRLSKDRGAGALKITFSQYYLPGGRSTQAEGVPSDVVIPSPFEGRVVRESERDEALPADKIGAARFKPDGSLKALLPELRSRSAARVAAEPRFAAIARWQAWLEELEAQTATSLNLVQRRAELALREERSKEVEAMLGGERHEAEAPPPATDPSQVPLVPDATPEPEQDPVLDEALAIAADLLALKG